MSRAFVTVKVLSFAVKLPPVTKFIFDALANLIFKASTSVSEATFAFRIRIALKLLAGSFKVMLLFDLKILSPPGNVRTPICVILPTVLKSMLPEMLIVPSTMSFMSVIVAPDPLLMFSVPKLFVPEFRLILPVPAVKFAVPVTFTVPVSVISLLELFTVSVVALTVHKSTTPEADTFNVVASLRRMIHPRSTKVATLALVIVTVPKLFEAFSSVMLLDPAASFVEEPTDKAPLCVMSPPVVTFKLVTLLVPRLMAPESYSVATFALDTFTVPKLLLTFERVILLPPATKVVVPVAVST